MHRAHSEGNCLLCAADYSVFVGDLAPDVTDYALQENFRHFFASVRSAKVLPHPPEQLCVILIIELVLVHKHPCLLGYADSIK